MHTKPSILVAEWTDQDQRLDNFLLKKLKGVPKSHIYRILRTGEVRVNKKRAKPSYRVQEGDQVRLPPVRLEEKSVSTPPQRLFDNLQSRILYEDKNLLIINKPSGMAVHGGSGVSFGVIEVLRAFKSDCKFIELVHRLDRETSGCLILAKKPSILRELHDLIRNDKIEKRYLALVKGHWSKRKTRVDEPLQKNQLRSGERIVKVDPSGKPSITDFKVIQRFQEATLVEATLRTGRTHQIRVHTAHHGHPIAGDDKYGEKEFNQLISKIGCRRLFLHAAYIRFQLSNDQIIQVESPLDLELTECLSNLN